MAPKSTDTKAATDGDDVVGVPRRRGKSKSPNFKYDGPVSVIRLELDATDERTRRRLEAQWEAVFRLRRALQRDATPAEQAALGPPPNRPGTPGRRGTSRKRQHLTLSGAA